MIFLIVHGPNLNLLGQREPEIYGSRSFTDFLAELTAQFPEHQIQYFQSNVEGALIDCLQEATQRVDGIILNAGGFTHTSVALADAVASIPVPVMEVHISNIFGRESFRHVSLLQSKCVGTIAGLGLEGYRLAIEWLADYIKQKS